jgi:hypothetical protein
MYASSKMNSMNHSCYSSAIKDQKSCLSLCPLELTTASALEGHIVVTHLELLEDRDYVLNHSLSTQRKFTIFGTQDDFLYYTVVRTVITINYSESN